MKKFLVLMLFASGAMAQGVVTLSWVPPSEYEDGSALNPVTGLSGYRIYVDGAGVATAPNTASTYQVTGLSFGTHSFAVSALATNGQESELSNVVSRAIVDNRVPKPPTLLDAVVAFLKRLVRFFGFA